VYCNNTTFCFFILYLGNSDLADLTQDELYKRHICGHHFLDNSFTSYNKCRLKKSSFPQPFVEIDSSDIPVNIPIKTYSAASKFPSSPHQVFEIEKIQSTSTTSFCELTKRIRLVTPVKSAKYSTSKSNVSTPEISPKTASFFKSVSNLPLTTALKPKQLFNKSTSDADLILKLKQTVARQKKTIALKRVTISKLKKNLIMSRVQNRQNKSVHFMNLLTFPSENSKTLVNMQVSHRKFKPWSQKEKQFALSLFYKSPSAYKFLFYSKQISLPGLSSIRRWVGSSKCRPGFSPVLFKQLQIKVDSMSEEEKYCTLVFDEMKIKNFLEYSKYLDLVEGYEDLGPKGRTNKLAGQAMVMIIRGVYSSWKMPIAYFLPATSVKHKVLSELLEEAVKRLFDCGLIVKALVCDQGASNVAAYKDLGITKDKPYFFVDGKKVFTMFDVPHLFKNLRNHFRKNNLLFNGEEVSFKDIKDTYDIDKNSSTSRSLLKITDAHINPGPFQLMSCKLAMQLFSNKVATTMKTCIMTQQLKSKTAPNTVEMIKKLNDLLDCLNSNSLFDSNPFKCALSDKCPRQLEFLLKAKTWFESLKKISADPKQPLRDVRPACFDGMVWTINAITMLYEEQIKIGYSYLLLRRLNSDAIENMFAVFRQRGGYNR